MSKIKINSVLVIVRLILFLDAIASPALRHDCHLVSLNLLWLFQRFLLCKQYRLIKIGWHAKPQKSKISNFPFNFLKTFIHNKKTQNTWFWSPGSGHSNSFRTRACQAQGLATPFSPKKLAFSQSVGLACSWCNHTPVMKCSLLDH